MNAPSSFSEEKLTAYALGELSPAERREVETELDAHPELQAELESIQTLASQLRTELFSEASDVFESPLERGGADAPGCVGTSYGLTEKIEPAQPDSDKIISFRRNPWLYGIGLLAAAACAALMAWPTLSSTNHASQKSPRAEVEEITAITDLPVEDKDGITVPTTLTVSATPAQAPDESAPPAPPESDAKPMEMPAPMATMASTETKTPASPLPASEKAAAMATSTGLAELGQAQAAGGEYAKAEESFQLSLAKDTKNKAAVDGLKQVYQDQSRAAAVPSSSLVADASVPAKKKVAVFGFQGAPVAGVAAGTGSVAVSAPSVWRGDTVTASVSGGMTPLPADKSLRNEASMQDLRRSRTAPVSGESYLPITDNAFLRVGDQALSTFSIDVDTGSYTNLRRFLNQGQLPPPDAVRIEELVNYFNYNYPQTKTDDPFSVTTEVAKAPWKDDHLLVRIGLQGKTVSVENRPPANLVFLIDVSGSMNQPNKLPLVIDSMKLLVQKLKPGDRVGIAVYAGNSGMVLPSTPVSQRGEILEALSNLSAGGSTNGAMGIQLAYDMAKAHYIDGGINRVILCTDGDFNVGVTDRGDLIKLIEEKAKSKVFLSVFGFGMGNLQDATLEQLANKGNGNYGYIDTPKEAKRVFVDQVGGTLQTIAKDVKIQVEFNPAVVASYRLIGYENRMLAARDFNDDKKDAGEIGAGHRVTALYELIPVGVKEETPSIDPLKYQKTAPVEYAGDKSEIMNVKLRYKQPEGDSSKLIEHPVKNENIRSFSPQKNGWFRSAPESASDDFQFAAGVAAFGMILRDSPYKGASTFDLILQLTGKGSSDRQEDRMEFIGLVKKARAMFKEPKGSPE